MAANHSSYVNMASTSGSRCIHADGCAAARGAEPLQAISALAPRAGMSAHRDWSTLRAKMRSEVQIFTFKEGLLARLAHDLRLSARVFEITLQQGQISGHFAADSLQVDGVAFGERVDADALSAQDKQKIRHTIQTEILDSARHPRIEVSGTLKQANGRYVVAAKLRLRGVERAIEVPVALLDDKLTAQVSFAPSIFGIAPYKALAGAIRLKDLVLVRVSAPANGATLDALATSAEPHRFTPDA
jgi:hypothetical protein